MILAKIRDNEISMVGHAGCRKNGVDVVCAAISALTCNLILSLENLTSDKIEYDIDHGMTTIKWQELSDTGKLLIDSWFCGISAINDEHNCITFN